MAGKKLNGTVIVTYRCNARCNMCNRFKEPSKPEDELTLETIRKLPQMYFTNITGGEPFIREDLPDIVRELYKKSDRIVISTNGFFTDRILALCEEFPEVGIRISIEGMPQTNDEIRGLPDGFERGYSTLEKLVEAGHPDVGFGMTIQDRNAADLVPLYEVSDILGMEFATASLHNSFYFVESGNVIHDRQMVAQHIEDLVNRLLESNEPKKWFRAYFNHGLINYIYGQPRLLPCDMAFDTFFIDPFGDVMPCNGTREKEVMGNLNRQSWDGLWNSSEAEAVRAKVRHCDRNCWMIGSVSPAMHKYIQKPAAWVAAHKLKPGKKYDMHELQIVRDFEEGTVTKGQLDALSTCEGVNDSGNVASPFIPNSYQETVPVKQALTEVQEIELSMFKTVAGICDRHDIPYYALGGTLLGAARHKGFIPWDDDIDIAIPRPDYDRFIALVNDELPSNLKAKTYLDEQGESHPMFICIIKNLDTEVELRHANEVEHTNVWLDVFPLDAMPSNSALRTIQKYKLLYERMMIQFSMYDENVHQHRAKRPPHELALMRFREITGFGSGNDTYELMCHIEKTLRRFNYDEEDHIVNMFGAYKFREMFPKSWFGEGIELPFEDTVIRCPVRYDLVLSQMYGEYMTPPPEAERGEQHRMTVISLGSSGSRLQEGGAA